VVDGLLAGKSLRELGKLAGVSHTVVRRYKRTVVAPALLASRKVIESQAVTQPITQQISETAALTRALSVGDPIISRLQKRSEERAEVLDAARKDGEYGAYASLDRNELSTIELEARLAGRLDSGSKTQVNVMVFSGMPPDWAGSMGDNRSQGGQDDVIDIESVNITPGSPDQT
jgi:hypothetical protein